MLAKDVFTVNDLDNKIQELIAQLNELMTERIEITSETCPLSRKLKQAPALNDIDFSSIDLTLDSGCGLSLHKSK